ncbi:hypothetical protein STEG23_004773 [Scotinomys teguina]
MAIPGIPYERRLLIVADPRDKALQDYRKKLLEHKEIDDHLKELREQLKELTKQYEKSENDLKARQSVGQIVGEVLEQLTEEKFIVKAANGPRYIVGCRCQLDKRRLDRKIHIDLPNEQARLDILKIHTGPITKHSEIDYEAIVKLSDGFNGADLRNVCTEAGMFAILADHDFVVQEDFMKAVRKVIDSKKLESKLDYKPV